MGLLAITDAGEVRDIRCDENGLLCVSFAPPIEAMYEIGAVAANAIVATPAIDLGPAKTRQHHLILAVKHGISSSGESLAVQLSMNGSFWFTAPNAAGATSSAWTNSSSNSMQAQARVMARYARVYYTNGSTDQTALRLIMTAIAGV